MDDKLKEILEDAMEHYNDPPDDYVPQIKQVLRERVESMRDTKTIELGTFDQNEKDYAERIERQALAKVSEQIGFNKAIDSLLKELS